MNYARASVTGCKEGLAKTLSATPAAAAEDADAAAAVDAAEEVVCVEATAPVDAVDGVELPNIHPSHPPELVEAAAAAAAFVGKQPFAIMNANTICIKPNISIIVLRLEVPNVSVFGPSIPYPPPKLPMDPTPMAPMPLGI